MRSARGGAARGLGEPAWARRLLLSLSLGFVAVFVLLPLVAIAVHALAKGVAAYAAAVTSPDARAAVWLTLLTDGVAVPVNLVFGVAAAWLIARYRFPGRETLLTLIDAPFAVSPVISGLIFVLLFGAQGLLGPWLAAHGVKIIFTTAGIVLATVFVTVPFVARELIPLMEAQGVDQEEAALTLGAGGLQILRRVTLPNVRWALIYGVILLNARAMGEFGAVSVVSGHVRGLTNTLPLHVEILYNEYDAAGAFAAASLLTGVALVTLALKSAVEWRAARQEAR